MGLALPLEGDNPSTRRSDGKYGGEESSPIVANVEHFRSIQEEVGLRAVDKARRNLLYASFQDLWVENGAARPGQAGLVWRSVEWASAALVWVTSALDNLITAMCVTPSKL